MDYFNPGLGLFFIILGFLVKKYPNLIAGYNTLSVHQKKNIDIDGLSSHMRNTMIGMGILIAISGPLLGLIGLKELGGMFFILIVVIGALFMFINAQTFEVKSKNQASKKIIRIAVTSLFFALLLLFVGRLIYKGTLTPEFQIEGKQLVISCMYGVRTSISSIDLLDSIPRIIKKTNGFNYGSILKGDFDIEQFGDCKLYIESEEPPYIFINSSENVPIIINLKTEKNTKRLFKKLNAEIKLE